MQFQQVKNKKLNCLFHDHHYRISHQTSTAGHIPSPSYRSSGHLVGGRPALCLLIRGLHSRTFWPNGQVFYYKWKIKLPYFLTRHHLGLYTPHCWGQDFFYIERAVAVPTRTRYGLGTSLTRLNWLTSFAQVSSLHFWRIHALCLWGHLCQTT